MHKGSIPTAKKLKKSLLCALNKQKETCYGKSLFVWLRRAGRSSLR